MRPAAPAIISTSILAALTAVTSPASAAIVLADGESVSLESIFGDGGDRTVRIGDKEFVFGVFQSHFAASGITLTARIDDTPNGFGQFDTGFDLGGSFFDVFATDDQPSVLSIGFTVTVVPEAVKNGVLLCDAWMQFDGDASGVGSYAEIVEHLIAPPNGESIGELQVYDIVTPAGDELTRRKHSLEFCGPDGAGALPTLVVEKTATFFAAPGGGVSGATLIEQRFSQIPAPGALALAIPAGLMGRRRRRS